MKSVLIGNPVKHSFSSIVCEYIAKQKSIDYVHEKHLVKSKNEIQFFLDLLKKREICGINVTMPYKRLVYDMVDDLDVSAERAGAVNTIVYEEGKNIGYNTDGIAAINAMKHASFSFSKDDKVLIFGSGGAATAVLSSLKELQTNNVVFSRNDEEIQLLKAQFGQDIPYKVNPDEEECIRQIQQSKTIINATSVGMFPEVEGNIIPKTVRNKIDVKDKQFFDVVLNPLDTSFITWAKRKGAITCSGVNMMIEQLLIAVRLWTNISLADIDTSAIREVIEREVTNGYL